MISSVLITILYPYHLTSMKEKQILKKEEEEYEDQVNWPVVLPILLILLAALIYAFTF